MGKNGLQNFIVNSVDPYVFNFWKEQGLSTYHKQIWYVQLYKGVE